LELPISAVAPLDTAIAVEQVTTPLATIAIRAKWTDKISAARLANRCAEAVVAHVRSANQESATAAGALLDRQVAEARARVDATRRDLLAFRRQTRIEAPAGSPRDRPLLASVDAELELERLSLELRIVEEAYRELSLKRLQRLEQVAWAAPELEIVEHAIAPAGPVSPRPARAALLGAGVGTMLTLLAAFVCMIARPALRREPAGVE
jgi:uncharacterized protein involved in exopolysaccharide biosynthesis